jgi:hypothetical protein
MKKIYPFKNPDYPFKTFCPKKVILIRQRFRGNNKWKISLSFQEK